MNPRHPGRTLKTVSLRTSRSGRFVGHDERFLGRLRTARGAQHSLTRAYAGRYAQANVEGRVAADVDGGESPRLGALPQLDPHARVWLGGRLAAAPGEGHPVETELPANRGPRGFHREIRPGARGLLLPAEHITTRGDEHDAQEKRAEQRAHARCGIEARLHRRTECRAKRRRVPRGRATRDGRARRGRARRKTPPRWEAGG